jgi:hypothetical protein
MFLNKKSVTELEICKFSKLRKKGKLQVTYRGGNNE